MGDVVGGILLNYFWWGSVFIFSLPFMLPRRRLSGVAALSGTITFGPLMGALYLGQQGRVGA